MTLNELESRSYQLTMGIIEMTKEINMVIKFARENEGIKFDCDGAWEHTKKELIKTINEVDN